MPGQLSGAGGMGAAPRGVARSRDAVDGAAPGPGVLALGSRMQCAHLPCYELSCGDAQTAAERSRHGQLPEGTSQGTATSWLFVSPVELPGALAQAQGKAGQVLTGTNNRDLFSHIHTYSTFALSYFKTENLT